MVSMLTSSVLYHGLQLWSGHTKDYNIDICCFYAKHAAFTSKNKDWLSRNQDNDIKCFQLE